MQQDYNEDDYQDYEQENMMQEQNIQTKIQLDYFEAQDLLRKGQKLKALKEFQTLYQLSEENKLKSWKVKILNELLQIYCKDQNSKKIKETLNQIITLNKQDKYTQGAIKSVILTMRTLKGKQYEQNRSNLKQFINELDNLGKIRSYILFLEKSVQDNQAQQTKRLFNQINLLQGKIHYQIPSDCLLTLFSLEIIYSKNNKINIEQKIRKMELKLPLLQKQAYITQGYMSILKFAFAQIAYKDCCYKICAEYLYDALKETMQHSSNINSKELLKINVIICLLCNNKDQQTKRNNNLLYNDSSTPFKKHQDILSLYNLIESFQQSNLIEFKNNFQAIKLENNISYQNIYQKLQYQLKKNKLYYIITPYKRISFNYLCKRLEINSQMIEQISYQLIVDNQIRGRIHKEDSKNKYLELLPNNQQFLEVQYQNLKELSKRYNITKL